MLIRIALICAIAAIGSVECANILLVSSPGKSHYLIFHSIGAALVDKGHSVYTVLPSSENVTAKEVAKIGIRPLMFTDKRTFNLPTLMEEFFGKFFESDEPTLDLSLASTLLMDDCKYMMDDDEFLQRVRSLDIKLAFVDGLPIIPCQVILAAKFGIPYITVDTIPFLTRIPSIPSFVPLLLNTYTDQMSFWQRTVNTFIFVAFHVYPIFPAWGDTSLIKKHVANGEHADWISLMLKSELLFSSRDSILEWPAPTMPHHKTVACLTCSPASPLPDDLESFYSKATNGVIVVSFGSMATGFPDSISQRFMDAFKRVDYHVIWRYVGVNEPKEVPANIKLMKWMPQNDLLGHNKTKLFVTHCGNNGHYESVYHGVPMVGFPISGDQPHNGQRMTSKKIGIELDIRKFTVDQLVHAIETVLGDKEYSRNVKKLSAIMKDSPLNPQETVVYWTEHILKFGGSHLRSYALDMPLYQFYLVDVAAFILGIILVFVLLVYCLLRLCCWKCRKATIKSKTA